MKALASMGLTPQDIYRKEKSSHRFYQDIVTNKVVSIAEGKRSGKDVKQAVAKEDNTQFVLGYN